MPALHQELAVTFLRQANERLSLWLGSLVPQNQNSESQAPELTRPGIATPQQIMGLLSELLRAGEWLRTGLPAERSPELEAQLDVYRRHVEHLRELLPSIHRALLAERARLETERRTVASATNWAHASRQTL